MTMYFLLYFIYNLIIYTILFYNIKIYYLNKLFFTIIYFIIRLYNYVITKIIYGIKNIFKPVNLIYLKFI